MRTGAKFERWTLASGGPNRHSAIFVESTSVHRALVANPTSLYPHDCGH